MFYSVHDKKNNFLDVSSLNVKNEYERNMKYLFEVGY